jgi:hypothetical protein
MNEDDEAETRSHAADLPGSVAERLHAEGN